MRGQQPSTPERVAVGPWDRPCAWAWIPSQPRETRRRTLPCFAELGIPPLSPPPRSSQEGPRRPRQELSREAGWALPVPLETQDSCLLSCGVDFLSQTATAPLALGRSRHLGVNYYPLVLLRVGESSMEESSVGCLPHGPAGCRPEGLRHTDVGARLHHSVLRKDAGHWGWLVEV